MPSAMAAIPAAANHPMRHRVGRLDSSTVPPIHPISMVPSVVTKFRVQYPPELKRKGTGRGKRFRNQRSKAAAALLFMFQ